MKHRTFIVSISLLCLSLLPALSPVSAQRHKSRSPHTTKVQPPRPPTPAHRPPTLEGTYALADLAAATKTVNEAIEATVKEISFLIRGVARGRLKKANLPPPQQISISFTPKEVTIKTEAGTIRTNVEGTFVDRTVRGDKVKVSTRKWNDDKLERTFKGDEGERVNTYSLSCDGKMLTMLVIVTSSRLPRPLTYQLNYKRR